MRKTRILLILITLFLTLFKTSFANAQSTNEACQPVYGGGTTCVQSTGLVVTKQIQNPQNGQYITAYPIYTIFYSSGQTVPFKITLANTSNTTLSGISVQDQFPNLLEYLSGNGTYNKSTGILTTTIPNLQAHSSTTLYVSGKVAGPNQFPSKQSNVCVVNQVTATVNNESSVANSQFCLSNALPNIEASSTTSSNTTSSGGLPVYPPIMHSKTTPDTGPQALAVIALLPIGILGILLQKASKLKSSI